MNTDQAFDLLQNAGVTESVTFKLLDDGCVKVRLNMRVETGIEKLDT